MENLDENYGRESSKTVMYLVSWAQKDLPRKWWMKTYIVLL
jgi:hypothetical protein